MIARLSLFTSGLVGSSTTPLPCLMSFYFLKAAQAAFRFFSLSFLFLEALRVAVVWMGADFLRENVVDWGASPIVGTEDDLAIICFLSLIFSGLSNVAWAKPLSKSAFYTYEELPLEAISSLGEFIAMLRLDFLFKFTRES